jgi:hypothetical protein
LRKKAPSTGRLFLSETAASASIALLPPIHIRACRQGNSVD